MHRRRHLWYSQIAVRLRINRSLSSVAASRAATILGMVALSACTGQHPAPSRAEPSTQSHPRLLLSAAQGPRGSSVHVTAVHCERPVTGDELTWHDSLQRKSKIA